MKLQFTSGKILTQHEMTPNTFYKLLNIPFKNQHSVHENDENMLFWSQFKFIITFQLQFLEWFFLFFFIYNIWKKLHNNIKNKTNYFNFVLYYQIIRIAYFCVKTEKEKFYCISWKFDTKKNWKIAKIWKICLCFFLLPWHRGCRNNIDYDFKWFAISF